jgi:hypothetical protein
MARIPGGDGGGKFRFADCDHLAKPPSKASSSGRMMHWLYWVSPWMTACLRKQEVGWEEPGRLVDHIGNERVRVEENDGDFKFR